MMEMGGSEAQKLVWGGAIPLQIHLHDSEITALTPPPPLLVLGPRLGYLPLLAPLVKPHFSGSLPPVVDAMWFEYKGLPLKWYIPTGVLFDLLCAEPERPWNITVHFRGYPSELLSPCDGEDSVKWNFINSLKEAAYIINGNCKNVMNMSQSDQLELWKCVEKGNLEGYLRIASKLKLGGVVEEAKAKASSQPSTTEADHRGPGRTGTNHEEHQNSRNCMCSDPDFGDNMKSVSSPNLDYSKSCKKRTILAIGQSLIHCETLDDNLIHSDLSSIAASSTPPPGAFSIFKSGAFHPKSLSKIYAMKPGI